MARQRGVARLVKRALDTTVAATGLAATAPVLAGAAVAIKLVQGGPVFFRQTRPGLHGAPFVIYKLQTMKETRGPDGALLSDAERLTALGRLLRRTSIDELPQLLNVLKGEMSLVGPRPLLMQYLPLYDARQARRHEVLPGITGWAQIHGRNALSWPEKFELDVEYVERWSLALDAEILLRTALAVLRREGISAEGQATMPNFTGSAA